MHVPVPVHIGYRLPQPDDMPNDAATSTRRQRGGDQVRRSALDKVTINWEKHEFEPRWIGSETADCVAALQPGHYSDQGDRERDRFLAGTAERGETALLVSMLGYAHDTMPRSIMHSGGGDSVNLAQTMTVVHGSRLPARTNVRLAAGLTRADQDLGKRLLNRPADAPWWSLKLDGLTLHPGAGGPPETYPAVGALQPILVDPLGGPVVATWISPNEQIRWYIVPDDIDWNVVLDWLIHQAIPAYVPQAARRHRTSSFVHADLLTPAERDAQQAFAEMENHHAEERQRLQADLDRARQDANPIRDGLFYGTGDNLVRAVETVLRSAGFDVVDLDAELGRTASADLLVTLGDHRRLVEVKSEGRNASESLVNDLLKHLRTWPKLRPKLPVGGGALVVNHQHRLPPNERTRAVYSRQEFIDTLTVPVIAVHNLFNWWRTSNWPTIQHAILGTEPPAAAHAQTPSAAPTAEEPPPEESAPRRRGWRFGRQR